MVSFGKKSSLWSVRRGDCGRRSGFEPSPRGAEKSGSGRFRSSPALRCAHPDTDCSPGRGRQAAPRRKRGRNPSLVLMKQTCPQWFVSGTLRELRRLVFHQRQHLILRHVRGIVLRSRRGACIRANRIARMSQSAPALDAAARNVRPDPPGVYRRSRNQHPYGSAEGPLAMWERRRSARALGNAHIHGWLAMQWSGRSFRDRGCDGWTAFLGLCQTGSSPTLKHRQIVVMDNLPVHKVDGVEDAIKATGATLLFLPRYSPISTRPSCFSLNLRAWKAARRTIPALQHRIGTLLRHHRRSECVNYFKHAGYGLRRLDTPTGARNMMRDATRTNDGSLFLSPQATTNKLTAFTCVRAL